MLYPQVISPRMLSSPPRQYLELQFKVIPNFYQDSSSKDHVLKKTQFSPFRQAYFVTVTTVWKVKVQ